MYYEMSPKIVNNLVKILSMATIKGLDAQKIVIMGNLFQGCSSKPYYPLDDQMREWLLDTIDGFEIKGSEAPAVVEIQHALTHPHKEMPKKTDAPDKVVSGGDFGDLTPAVPAASTPPAPVVPPPPPKNKPKK